MGSLAGIADIHIKIGLRVQGFFATRIVADLTAGTFNVCTGNREVVPDLPEIVLLKDDVKQLDEPFLVVVVGEFNSGKSSVINSLLGDEEGAETRVVQQADGLYVKSFPSKLLEEMYIVDIPGTNVIQERQQRLTEEYVPCADLVLFVMSVDRALTGDDEALSANPATMSQEAATADDYVQQLTLARQKGLGSAVLWKTVEAREL
eukprot:1149203-Pelagomonas_calceolata.AAC.2